MSMKSGLFARPNLKLFVVAAIFIVALDHFLSDAASEEANLLATTTLSAAPLSDDELERLIDLSFNAPTSENFVLISDCLRRRGETKRAMHYLRKAALAAQLEEEP